MSDTQVMTRGREEGEKEEGRKEGREGGGKEGRKFLFAVRKNLNK